MKRQLLVRASNWIGDCVMSVAALRELRRLQPETRLTVAGRRWVTDLFEGQSFVDRVFTWDRPGYWNRFRAVGSLRGSDSVLLFPNSFSSALSPFLARVPQRLGYQTDGRSFLLTHRAQPRTKQLGLHQAFYYLDLIHQLGLSETDYVARDDFAPDISLEAPGSGVEEANRLLREIGIDRTRPLVILSPGAAFGPAKRWYPDRYAAVADLLVNQEGAQILLVGSAQEQPLAELVLVHMKRKAHDLSGRTTLATLMGLLSECDLLLTNDSGPMHLAAALNRPQVALFGSTDEIATGPLCRRAVVIHKHVECSPCLLRECPIDLRCFDRITVEEVFEAARGLLTANQSPRR